MGECVSCPVLSLDIIYRSISCSTSSRMDQSINPSIQKPTAYLYPIIQSSNHLSICVSGFSSTFCIWLSFPHPHSHLHPPLMGEVKSSQVCMEGRREVATKCSLFKGVPENSRGSTDKRSVSWTDSNTPWPPSAFTSKYNAL